MTPTRLGTVFQRPVAGLISYGDILDSKTPESAKTEFATQGWLWLLSLRGCL